MNYSNPTKERMIYNWPFGGGRATVRFSIEVHPKRGERAVRVTSDPLTGKTFQPRKLTFARRMRIVDGDDGRTYILEDNTSHLTVMQGNMKYQQEAIFERDPRFTELLALFDVGEAKTDLQLNNEAQTKADQHFQHLEG